MERRHVRGAGSQPEPPPLWDAENVTMEDDGPMFPGCFKVSAVLAALVAAVWGGWAAANTAGVCIPEWHRLTDEEVLDRATTAAMHMRESRIKNRMQNNELPPSAPVARYDDPARFAADHPDCCEIVPVETLREEEQTMANRGRPWGRFRAYVRIRYTAGPGDAEVWVQIVTNCGLVRSNIW